MRASALEFRLRVVIVVAIILLGFWSPWAGAHRISLLEWLALELSRLGAVSFAAATPIVIVLATLIAAVAVWLRVWGAAYLGAGVVNSGDMHAGAVMADGPYRFVRNPLYLGSWCMVTAIAFAMPVSGAAMTIVLVPLFYLRLILGEEKFLSGQLGEPYQAYLRAVPRLIPLVRSKVTPGGGRPRWTNAVLSELNPIGVLLVTAVLSWWYDNALVTRAFLVSFGVSLVLRALLVRNASGAPAE